MAESDLNDRIRKALHGRDPRRCENAVDPGTPDIHYIGGWIESKYEDEWPAKPTTVLRLKRYAPEQRAWHVRRCAAGGTVFVALEVDSEFHLFQADMAARYLGVEWTRADCRACALLWSPTWDERRVRKFFVDYHQEIR